MRKLFALFIIASLIGGSVSASENPFYSEWDTPYGVPDFGLVKTEHYMPAFTDGMKQELVEVEAIANNQEAPTFENTIEALEATGAMLERVNNVFFNLNSSNTNDEMQDIAKEVAVARVASARSMRAT